MSVRSDGWLVWRSLLLFYGGSVCDVVRNVCDVVLQPRDSAPHHMLQHAIRQNDIVMVGMICDACANVNVMIQVNEYFRVRHNSANCLTLHSNLHVCKRRNVILLMFPWNLVKVMYFLMRHWQGSPLLRSAEKWWLNWQGHHVKSAWQWSRYDAQRSGWCLTVG